MVVAGTSKQSVVALKAHLTKEFDMKDLGQLIRCFGGQCTNTNRVNRKIWITQISYTEGVLCHFNMQNLKLVSTHIPVG